MTEFIKGSIFITFSNYLFFFVHFLASIFIVRLLPVTEYGLIGYFGTVYILLFPLYNLNLQSAITHFISKYQNKWKVFRNSVKIFLIWAPIITVSSVFLFIFLENVIFLILILIFLINSLIQFILGYLRGVMNFKFYSIILITNNFITILTLIFVIISSNAIFYYLGYLTAVILIFIISLLLLRKNQLSYPKSDEYPISKEENTKKELLKYSLPLMLLSLISFFGAQYDKLLIFNTEGELIAGNYYFLIFYTSILGSLFLSINDALFPIISEKFYKKIPEDINYYYQNILKFSLLIYFLVMTYLVLLGEPLINFFFGTKYLSYINLLGILFFSSIFGVFGYCTTTMYLSFNIVKKMTIYLIIIIITSLIIKTILVLFYGIWGAALSVLTVELLSQIILIKILLRNTNLIFPSKVIFKIAVIGLTNFLVFYGLSLFFDLNFEMLCIFSIISFILLILSIRFLKIFNKNDFEIIKSIFIHLRLGETLAQKIVGILQIVLLSRSCDT